MAKTIQNYKLPGDPQQVLSHLRDHLANYSQYFSVGERGPDMLLLRIRNVVKKHWEWTKPGFRVQVSAAGSGSRIVLQRTLGPIANWFFGIFTTLAAISCVAGLVLQIANPADWLKILPFTAGSAVFTVVGLGFRQVYYFIDAGRDRELTGILEKSISDFGRPTAIRRREQSRMIGPGPSAPV